MRTTDRNGLKMPDGDDIDFPGAMEDNTEIIDDAISKCNFYASSDPLVTDDSTKGYSVGSIWVNGTSKIFQCVDPTPGAAVWIQIYPSTAAAHHATHETGGSDVIVMSNLKHAALHQSGGADAIKLDDLAAPDDNTDLNVSTTKHGLCPKAPNNASMALLGNASWGYPLSDGWIPAGETWTYASAEDPTFTFTVSGDKTTKYYPGMRLKLTQTTAKYFIVTKVTYSSPNTTVTIYGGTDYDLTNATITNPFYSMMKAPAGFPLDPLKWTVSLINTTIYEQSNPVNDQWYNLGSLSIYIPIGAWRVDFWVVAQALQPSAAGISLNAALSTSTSSATDSDLKMLHYLESCTGYIGLVTKGKYLNIDSKTRYYVIESCNGTNISKLYCNGASSATKVMAVCAYL